MRINSGSSDSDRSSNASAKSRSFDDSVYESKHVRRQSSKGEMEEKIRELERRNQQLLLQNCNLRGAKLPDGTKLKVDESTEEGEVDPKSLFSQWEKIGQG